MESIGDKLKSARLEKDISIEKASRETNISRRYLESLESEDYSCFPGETYLMGFLRNYAEYLGLNADAVLTLYRNFKKQEQPVPMEELIVAKQFPLKKVLVGIIAVLLAGLIVLSGVLLTNHSKKMKKSIDDIQRESNLNNVYEFEGSDLMKTLMKDDGIVFYIGNRAYTLIVSDVGKNIEFKTGEQHFTMSTGETRKVKLNNDADPDVRIIVEIIDEIKGEARVRMDKSVFSSDPETSVPESTTTAAAQDVTVSSLVKDANIFSPISKLPANENRIKQAIIIDSAAQKKAIQLSIEFKQTCYFRYSFDKKKESERLFKSGEVLNITAEDYIYLYFSNLNALRVLYKNAPVTIGSNQVTGIRQISWVKNQERNVYELKSVPIY